MKAFDEWNEVKKVTNNEHKPVYFKERDIFWMKIGKIDEENFKTLKEKLMELIR